MPKSTFSGRVSYVVLIISMVIVIWGVVSFLSPHETLLQNPQNNLFFKSNPLDTRSDIKDIDIKTLVLTTQKIVNPEASPLRFVNGEANPIISIRPGEIQRWRFVNKSENDFFNLSIPGLSFFVVARDGNVTTIPISVADELLAPGDSIEILIQGPGWGNYDVISKNLYGKGSGEKFMTLKSEGFPVFNSELPESLVPNYDLRNANVSNYKNFTISGGNDNVLKGKETSKKVEEWVIVNTSSNFVPFYNQDNSFQVVEINGNPIERYGYDNVFTAPPKGVVKIRVQ